jgi:2-oxoglutarate ferredoxin oxidoreductase subunit beta
MMDLNTYNMGDIDIAWCPGCGNFGILNIIKETLAALDIAPQNLVVASGIGQAPKTPHYFRTNLFNGLHGRAVSPAVAVKSVNPNINVIAEGGDGDMYGEGGNHFIHNIRRNPNITHIVHNNMVYGLTKGQASPTSQKGFKTPIQVNGVILEPFNPLAVAVALDASFVARTFAGDKEHAIDILKQAMTHKGYALVDIFQPCVTFNKVNTYQWFKKNTYKLEDEYDPTDRMAAFQKATETEKFPLGVIYKNSDKPTFEESLYVYKENDEPVYKRTYDKREKLHKLMQNYK